MSRNTSNTHAAQFPAAAHVRAIRVGLALAIAAALLAFAVRAGAQERTSGTISTHAASSTLSGTTE